MAHANEPEEKVTTIRATCPTCGEVELTPDDIELRVCTHAPASYYQFVCPLCAEEIQKPADDRVVQLLISGGVPATVWELPQEVREAHEGPTLTLDDLLDFHLLLEQPDWFQSLLKVSARS
jgi:predicted RNA-binding Zn-ribbon protein involved in translation (DUF1610 family)